MAKGRKLTTSRSERYLGYGYGNGDETEAACDPEFAEDDVWSMVDDMVNGDDHLINGSLGEWSSCASSESNNNRSLSIRSRRRAAEEDSGHVGGLSLAFDDSSNNKTATPRIVRQFRGQDHVASPRGPNGQHVATSAPVNVPDWTKIYRVNSVESMHDLDNGADGRDLDMVPPHEYLRHNRKMAANSVFQGVGRTLKGRDMSRVREAVWSQTGFNG